MSALHGAANRSKAQDPASAAAVGGSIDAPGVYLTNEAFLYRVVRLDASGTDEMVELEDCYWLDVVRVPARDVRARRLRVVTPAPAEG